MEKFCKNALLNEEECDQLVKLINEMKKPEFKFDVPNKKLFNDIIPNYQLRDFIRKNDEKAFKELKHDFDEFGVAYTLYSRMKIPKIVNVLKNFINDEN